MKKFFTLFLMLTGMVLTANADVYIKGDFDSWGTGLKLTGTQLRGTLSLSSNLTFKLYDSSSDSWYGYNQLTMTSQIM